MAEIRDGQHQRRDQEQCGRRYPTGRQRLLCRYKHLALPRLEIFEIKQQVFRHLITLLRVLAERATNNVLQFAWYFMRVIEEAGRLSFQDIRDYITCCLTLEGRASRNHFVEHHAEAEDV